MIAVHGSIIRHYVIFFASGSVTGIILFTAATQVLRQVKQFRNI